jgi:hypothetical protein
LCSRCDGLVALPQILESALQLGGFEHETHGQRAV